MGSKKIKKIYFATDGFYHFVKKSVPLSGFHVTPYSEYYDPEATEESIRISHGDGMDLPSVKEFEKHYKNTKINYRIIYCKFDKIFGLRSDNPINIEEYRDKIKSTIDSMELSEEVLEEGNYLLNNFNNIFDKDSVNIIANKYDAKDLTGPKGIDHDLGHAVIDKYENAFKTDDFIKAIDDDYEIETTSHFGEVIKLPFDKNLHNYKRTAFVLLTTILANSNIVSGSISEMNLKNKELTDLLPDLFVMYNLSGESLEKINLQGITLYANNVFSSFSLDSSEKFTIILKPKNQNIPNINKELKKILIKIEKSIKNYLNSLVGKVVILW